jgi:hypothetical protein
VILKYIRWLQLLVVLAILIGTCTTALCWDVCYSDADDDQDVDGMDIQVTAHNILSVVDPKALENLAAELGSNGCNPSPLIITSPADGQTVNAKWVMVEGSIGLPPDGEVGMTVNGAPAMVYNDHYALNHLPLEPGNNHITVKAVNAAGNILTRSISVNAVWPDHYIRLDADTETGLTPLVSRLYVSGTFTLPGPTMITPSGPGTVTFLESDTDRFKIEITTPGVYYLMVTVTGPQSTVYSDTLCIIALEQTTLDALLRAKWQGMLGSLLTGDTQGASAYMASNVRSTYQYNFDLLNSHLGTIVSGLHDMELVRITGTKAEYNVQGDQDGQTYSFYVVFIKDSDGIWRISFF